ncbi:MAG TPA: DUF488 family protein [Thermoplasmata archaeon]|nr:DUF488 family protein [Thermoplasmata archaeon]
MITMKRVYEPASPTDGMRVLIDRLWPRGVSKRQARVDRWMREIAPTDGLRRWFGHDPERYPEFRERYLVELSAHRSELRELASAAQQGPLTLLYAARDPEHSNARVLWEILTEAKARRSSETLLPRSGSRRSGGTKTARRG